jgi:DNA-binding NarL/FixJ family response regulator
MTGESVRVLICDDQKLLRQGLRLLLDGDSGITIVGEAADGAEALKLVPELRPAVVLMDLRMPNFDGVETTRALSAQHPDVRVLILTTYGDDALVQAALQAGAAGYLLKDADASDIIAAIRAVHRGGVWLQTPRAAALLTRLAQGAAEPPKPDAQPAPSGLTARERDVVTLIARGYDNRRIAEELVISEATVKTHINNIFSKLGATERTQVVVFAYRHKLVT